MKKIISIIIPVYNNGALICRCLDSIIDYVDLSVVEIIVVNDGSTDDTMRKLEKYKNNIQIINQRNQGVSFARNQGIENASGKYVWFVDGDDEICKNSLDSKTIELLAYYDYDWYLFGFEKMKKNYKEKVFNKKSRVITNNSLNKYFTNLFTNNDLNGPWNKFYKLSFLKNNNIKFNKFANGEDAYFNYQVLLKFKSMRVINKIKYIYYLNNPKSISHYRMTRNNMIDAVERINYFEYVLKKLDLKEDKVYNRELINTILGIYKNLFSNNYKEYKKLINQNEIRFLKSKAHFKIDDFRYMIKWFILQTSWISYLYFKC